MVDLVKIRKKAKEKKERAREAEKQKKLQAKEREKQRKEREAQRIIEQKARAEERERFSSYVDRGGATNDRKQALGDVFWVLLNSSEFSVNH